MKNGNRRAIILTLSGVGLAALLGAVNAPDAPTATTPSGPDPPRHECEFVRGLAADLQKRKAAGLTEREALAELSARGEYNLGYVVDGVFDAEQGSSEAMTRHDIVATCKRVATTGAVY